MTDLTTTTPVAATAQTLAAIRQRLDRLGVRL
jgi:hypothetical protein